METGRELGRKIREMGSKDGSTATFDYPEGEIKANHPKGVRKE